MVLEVPSDKESCVAVDFWPAVNFVHEEYQHWKTLSDRLHPHLAHSPLSL